MANVRDLRILLTGATGFVGSNLLFALEAQGHSVSCTSRHPETARRKHPDQTWVQMDVEDQQSVESALEGCEAAFYLIHGIGQGANYPEREAQSARNFVQAAQRCGVGRIVYLGGVLPQAGRASKHLGSRQKTGQILRDGPVSAIEIRAAMIIGHGSISWMMVKDLAARLPAMLLPRWLKNNSYPVARDDVIWALLAGLGYPGKDSKIYEIPGPERIAHRDVLKRVARLLGHTRPMLNIPILSPKLSSYWIALVTRVDLGMAQELVEGVRFDLEPQERVLWQDVEHQALALEVAAQLALNDEENILPTQRAARMRAIGEAFNKEVVWSTSAAVP